MSIWNGRQNPAFLNDHNLLLHFVMVFLSLWISNKIFSPNKSSVSTDLDENEFPDLGELYRDEDTEHLIEEHDNPGEMTRILLGKRIFFLPLFFLYCGFFLACGEQNLEKSFLMKKIIQRFEKWLQTFLRLSCIWREFCQSIIDIVHGGTLLLLNKNGTYVMQRDGIWNLEVNLKQHHLKKYKPYLPSESRSHLSHRTSRVSKIEFFQKK